jgi:hypothetical protein
MNFQIDTSPTVSAAPLPAPEPPATETVHLLRQILEVQKEQLAYQRAALQVHDMSARWRAFLARYQEEFDGLSEACRKALPSLERCYGRLIAELAEHLNEADGDALDSDFAIQEFLDRYGMRLAQLGTILSLVGPLAEAGPTGEST